MRFGFFIMSLLTRVSAYNVIVIVSYCFYLINYLLCIESLMPKTCLYSQITGTWWHWIDLEKRVAPFYHSADLSPLLNSMINFAFVVLRTKWWRLPHNKVRTTLDLGCQRCTNRTPVPVLQTFCRPLELFGFWSGLYPRLLPQFDPLTLFVN